MRKEILRMKDICTNEASIQTVKNGNFHVFEKEIVGLVGKNHAGKSTMMGAVTGECPCTSGEIWIREKKKKIESIEQARKEGIFLIKDESSLIEEFTIEDMMRLNFAFAGQTKRYSEYVKKYKRTMELLEVSDPYDVEIQNLNFHKRVLIEIAQALVCDARLLVLDNVISMLSSTARNEMHELFQILLDQGLSLVLIENQETTIQDFLERLCVMRKGRVVAELDAEEMEHDLIMALAEGEMFVPREGELHVQRQEYPETCQMQFQKICTEDRTLKELSFELFENETLGIWNRNRHSGKKILDILEGKAQVTSGEIFIKGRKYKNSLAYKIDATGLSLVPEEDELFSNMNLGENIELSALKRTSHMGVAKNLELKYLVQDLCDTYMSDSGYRLFPNQRIPNSVLVHKKIALCRAVASGADIIVYNNPCLKMDMREREIFIQDILKTQKRKISQIIISSQLDTLYSACNRILQLEEGRVVKEIDTLSGV